MALAIPSPEQLGLAPTQRAEAPAAQAADWNATRARLRQLGATSFQLDRLPAGGYRFTCWLSVGSTNRVEAEAATEAEAVRLCLERAERAPGRTP